MNPTLKAAHDDVHAGSSAVKRTCSSAASHSAILSRYSAATPCVRRTPTVSRVLWRGVRAPRLGRRQQDVGAGREGAEEARHRPGLVGHGSSPGLRLDRLAGAGGGIASATRWLAEWVVAQ